MSKISFAILIAGTFSIAANAESENTIRFQGEVADETCTVTINGNTALPVILLPTVPVSALDTAGKTAGQTPFTIGVSGCTGAKQTDTNIKTIFIANNLTTDGRIGNTSTNNNVSLEIIDPANVGTKIDLTGVGNNGLILKANAKSASYDYAVRYYADSVASAGKVEGSVQYSISYQ
ncbi:fimbrial protein [Providencia rustigianii]|uniref:fimbrial protein n=1 Tax=Providencia rustigianii TaxID=158850 RepID=UPI000F6E6E05|nr:fimbrial protein [Providencia rustigianii]MTC58451.1 fimbrial protein [Providencia rustigianii]VEH54248.1 Major pilin [Providencia rustigianii]